MKRSVLIAGICMIMSGCSAAPEDAWYVNTGMSSALSDGSAYSVTAASLKKEKHSRNVIQYSLRPNPGTAPRDKWGLRYTTVLMNIALTDIPPDQKADISGEIRYYGTERYNNGRLVGDIIQTIPIPVHSVRLVRNKPVTLILPRDIIFIIELSTEQKMLNSALAVSPGA